MKKSVVILAGLIFLFLAVGTAQAATFTVTKTADTNDGLCDADCSFREALIAVNSNTSGGVTHRIEFSALFDTPQIIQTTQFFLNYNTRVEIIGRGNKNLTITTALGSLNGAFDINSAFCRIQNIRFSHCNNELNGGAIFGNDGGDLIIENCVFEFNNGYSGGAIDLRAFSSLTIKDSTFSNNRAYGGSSQGGGALFLNNYSQTISGSTFNNNESITTGSAVYFSGYSPTTSSITNSTFSGNIANEGSTIVNGFGAGILDLRNITVANNTNTADAINREGTFNNRVNLTNSIVSLNSSGDVYICVLPSDDAIINCVRQIAPNYTGATPMLGALTNNGGETETMALLPGSPAIDAGTLTGAPPTDQRGVARPQGAGFDLGAFEKETSNQQPQFVTNSNLPAGTANAAYSQQIVVTGGVAPYSFSLFSGTLPSGITLSTGGLIGGITTQTGSFSFVVKVTGADGSENQKQFNLNIVAPLEFVTGSNLPLSTVGEIYSQQIVVTGGTAPYSFLAVSGSLPNGVTLSSSGLISGTPTQTGTFFLTVSATDAQGLQIQREFNVRIRNSAPQFVTGNSLPAAARNQSYTQQIAVTGGNSPFDFSLLSGALPNGITLSQGGLLNGSPTQTGNFSFTVGVTDAEGLSNQRTFNLDVVIPPLQILTDGNLPRGVLNQLYSQAIQPAGGIAPYSFSFISGVLPSGVTFTASGFVDGTPQETGNFSFRLGVSDSLGTSVQKDFNLRVVNPPPQITNLFDLPKGFANRAYSQQIDAVGGTASYSFSVTGGTLPNGLALSPGGLISGAPTQTGFFFPRITVTDSEGLSGVKEFRLFVNSLPQFLTDVDLPTAFPSQPYRQKIDATGGSATLTFSIVGGTTGAVTISPDGYLSGMLNGPASHSVIIRVQNQFGDFAEKTFNLYVSAVFTVTKTADTDDGACNNDCSLREAISAARQLTSSVIEFSSLFDTPQTIVLTAPLNITGTHAFIEIRGKGANKLTIDGGDSTDLFFINSTNLVSLRNLRMINGNRAITSQGINNDSLLKIDNCVFENNSSTVNGGAISHQNGRLVVRNSTFRNNSAIERGGAIFVNLGFFPTNLLIESSTFVGNSAPIGSAVSVNDSGSSARIINSTFSGNLSTDLPNNVSCSSCYSTIMGETSADIYISNATVVNNDVLNNNGSALRARSGSLIQVQNSIIANNFGSAGGAGSPNIPQPGSGVSSLGHNLIGFADSYIDGLPNANNDYVGTVFSPLDPQLAPLAFNGGETQTHALQTGSLAIDHGNAVGDYQLFDQRGAARPQGFRHDIGAFESGAVFTSAVTPTGSNVNTSLGAVSVTFSGVSQSGTTSAVAIDPANAGTLPGGFSFGAGLPAFQLTTSASYTPPLTICVQIPGINDPIMFNALSFFHGENGTLVDRTVSRDFPTRTICAQTDSLSPFAVAQNLVPTAAHVSISGKVSSPDGKGLPNAIVFLTNSAGVTRTARTNTFGNYHFEEIEAGQTVLLGVRSKLFRFDSRVMTINEDLADVDFLPSSPEAISAKKNNK